MPKLQTILDDFKARGLSPTGRIPGKPELQNVPPPWPKIEFPWAKPKVDNIKS